MNRLLRRILKRHPTIRQDADTFAKENIPTLKQVADILVNKYREENPQGDEIVSFVPVKDCIITMNDKPTRFDFSTDESMIKFAEVLNPHIKELDPTLKVFVGPIDNEENFVVCKQTVFDKIVYGEADLAAYSGGKFRRKEDSLKT